MPVIRESTVNPNTKAGIRAATGIVTVALVRQGPPSQETAAAHTRITVAAGQRNDATATAVHPSPRCRPSCPWQ